MKHGCRLTLETIVTNYATNLSFFQSYGSNLYGLSGTLGCPASLKTLETIYSTDAIVIVPFCKSQYLRLDSLVYREKKKKWLRSIMKNVIFHASCDRAALIITEYIDQVELIADRLQSDYNYDLSKIRLYRTSKDSDVVKKPLGPGDIVIATNIAGRGTDFEVSPEANKAGGLYVCITFLPKTLRVQCQNEGRTARSGNPGCSQLIILST